MCLWIFRTNRDGRGRSPTGALRVPLGLPARVWEIGFDGWAVPLADSSGPQRGMSTDTPNPSSVLGTTATGRRGLIDVPALAIELGVTQRFIRRLVAEDRVPFIKIGKFVRFDPREIDRWVDEARRPTAMWTDAE